MPKLTEAELIARDAQRDLGAELLSGPRWELMAARASSGLSQAAFAQALGVSRRTLENWEQGRVQPTGAARRLLQLAAQFPDTLERLARI
ncbi:XRE family transcriptional regulator [Vitreoscilla filiformis]|uniref:XRE family transcriptional regulator n=1 Tax=Vitreoscilla filiformis TaxID=63 RepID=A0A221KI02_VITFI|nr:helix-turn-helix domain-containing protein [Vitreoscilla filiformis]ASM78585.1 XRE family transcriptional regulator [Vitreoscilla filiformis]